MFHEITISLIRSLILYMAFFVLDNVGQSFFYADVPQFSIVCGVFNQIWNSTFNTLQPLSRYFFNIKTVYICFDYAEKIS